MVWDIQKVVNALKDKNRWCSQERKREMYTSMPGLIDRSMDKFNTYRWIDSLIDRGIDR